MVTLPFVPNDIMRVPLGEYFAPRTKFADPPIVIGGEDMTCVELVISK